MNRRAGRRTWLIVVVLAHLVIALDRDALITVVEAARPTHVIIRWESSASNAATYVPAGDGSPLSTEYR